MFSFLRNLIFKKPAESKRQIFSYWDGFKVQHADPLEIQTRLELDPEYRADIHPELAYANTPEGARAFEVCINAYRNAFNLKPYDPDRRKGLIKAEILQLHATYCLYVDYLKKSTDLTQTPTQFGDATWTESDERTMSDTSVTSSINIDKSSDESIKSELAPSSES